MENHLYFHIFFLNVRDDGDLLPVITYYVVRQNEVFQVEPTGGQFEETATGDNLEDLADCKDLGEYAKEKIAPYDLGYINAKKLADVLANMNG